MSESTRTRRQVEEEETESTEEDVVCPECDGRLVVDDARGETVCESCGLVVDSDEIDRGPEWRAFDSKEKDEKSRVGA
ncbi:transcription initiation factor IIB 2, partial [Halapricum sp. CBA1109]|uniref:TFIIB-type zinc ribbon-containing protein n=1 Tax=Halapricum sp. CBA1109 TaxID=2668068 RepID=UPI0013BC6F20